MRRVFSRDPRTDRSLKHSLKDAAAFAVMTGSGETYFSAFALFLKASTPQIGLLASLPPLLASFVQLLSAWLGRLTGHRRRIILAGAAIQATSLVPLALLPLFFPSAAVPLLITCVVIYHSGANLVSPQWSSLMGDLVPERRRGRFFALRTRLTSATTFASLVLAGFLLHLLSGQGMTAIGYVCLFLVAAIARLVSWFQLARMHDPPGHVAAMEVPLGRGWWRRLRHSPFVRFSAFFALMQFAVAVASPFFTVYMLRDLHFSYLQFMANTATTVLFQFLTLARWGRISDAFGNRLILATCACIIPFLPILWTLSTNFWYLVALQALSGLSWAGFSLSAGNFLYDLVAREKRATYMAVHNVIASTGIFAGALLGGYLGAVMPGEITLLGHTLILVSPLYGVFAVSTAIRLMVVIALVPRLKEVRQVRPLSVRELIFRVTRLNALSGLFFDVVGSRPRQPDASREE
jgi:MFS family permease